MGAGGSGRRLRAATALVLLLAVLVAGCGVASRTASTARRSAESANPQPNGIPTDLPTDFPTTLPTTLPTGPSGSPSTGPAGPVPAGLQSYYAQQLDWEPCTNTPSTYRCALARVPLDYAHPDGRTIQLAMLKVPAMDPSRRLGTMFVNPGGPGGSGVQYAAAATQILGEPLLERYDVVGWDPRGVGQSDPVQCEDTSQRDTFNAADATPDDAAELTRLETLSKQFAQACERRSGSLLPYVGTPNVARDLDVLRSAVGDQKLTYLGKSYGTSIGATYAELFPHNVGRMVLDGAVDPTLSEEQLDTAQAHGFDVALAAYAADCAARQCQLGSSESAVLAGIDSLLTRSDAHPLGTGTSRPLTQALATSAVLYPLYDKTLWSQLTSALVAAKTGDGSQLLALADQYASRGPSGYLDNSGEVIYAVNCIDRPQATSPSALAAELPAFRKASPRLGESLLWGSLPCAYWPVKPQTKPHRITAPGSPPIVVVGTTRDPATPYAWAKDLAHMLSKGVLISRNGDGHTGYHEGNSCVDNAVETYFLLGRAPGSDLSC